MTKQDSINKIKEWLAQDNILEAISYWQDSYHIITSEEFLACNDFQNNLDLLESIKGLISSLKLAEKELSNIVNNSSTNLLEKMMAAADISWDSRYS